MGKSAQQSLIFGGFSGGFSQPGMGGPGGPRGPLPSPCGGCAMTCGVKFCSLNCKQKPGTLTAARIDKTMTKLFIIGRISETDGFTETSTSFYTECCFHCKTHFLHNDWQNFSGNRGNFFASKFEQADMFVEIQKVIGSFHG